MESFDQFKKAWNEAKEQPDNQAPISLAYLQEAIRCRVRKEKRVMMAYFWGSFVYQLIIYTLMSHLVIRFWGDWQTVGIATAGMLFYLPFTLLQLQKFKTMARAPIHQNSLSDMQAHVKQQYERLAGFYRFKRRFDWVGIPLTAFLFVVFIFKLFVKEGLAQPGMGALLTYLLVLTILSIAIYAENRKSFAIPLHQLALILKDMQRTKK
jgi:hypothetical protein